MKLLFSLMLSVLSFSLFSQSKHIHDDRCGHDAWLKEYEKIEPGYAEQIQKGLKDFNTGKLNDKRSSAIITIPVHVIVVHAPGQAEGTGTNFSMAHVQSQIDVLNQDFGRYNGDAGNTPSVFPAADTEIQFCLATVDPDGNPTDGITRYATTTSMGNSSGRTEVISNTRWPRESYMNIWSAPNLPFLGLATVPSTGGLPSNPNQDFILVASSTFGGPGFGTNAPYNLGRTTTHEVGHWFGLFHVWGGGGCSSDDGIADTPIQNEENFGCPNHPSPSCGNGGDMFMNYMDYVNDNCMNAFTEGQGAYMNTILNTSRASLQGSDFTNCTTVIPLSLNVTSQEDPSCSDSEDGFILVEAQGGTEPYTYSINGSAPTDNNLFTDLGAGVFVIDVFDANETSNVTVTLEAPSALTGAATIITENECPDDMNGVINLIPSGGTSPYFFTLNGSSTQSSSTFSNLTNGLYAYQITDDNACTFMGEIELIGSDVLELMIDSTSNITCSGDGNGFILASATGGSGPLEFSLGGIQYQVSGSFSDLEGNSYGVFVQDSIGCVDSMEVIISEPEALALMADVTNITCNGDNNGSISLSASGGNAGVYEYSIGGDFTTTSEYDSLSGGMYIVSTQDSKGCLLEDTVEVLEPLELSAIIGSIINSSCFGENNGAAFLVASGGTSPYTYEMADLSNTDGSFEDISAGSYVATITDSNDCSTTLNVGVDFVSTIQASVSSLLDVTCNGGIDGSISINAQNTMGTVSYMLEGGTAQSSNTFGNLSAGDYTVIVSDDTNCDAAVFVTINEPPALMAQVNVIQDVSCFGGNDGAADFLVSGGVAPYTYSIGNVVATGQDLAAGNYTLLITDANDCTINVDFEIGQPDDVVLATVSNLTEVDCLTGLGGGFTLIAEGGNGAPYTYSASNPLGTVMNDDGIFLDLDAGTYDLEVMDEKGCTWVSQTTISLEGGFSVSIDEVLPIPCFGGTGGGVIINVNNPSDNLTYSINGIQVTDLADLQLPSGDYVLTVTDENGCSQDLFFTLEEIEQITAEYEIDEDTDILTVLADGGTPGYMYSYDGGNTYIDDNTIALTAAGEFVFYVQDANGCVEIFTAIVSSVEELDASWEITAFPNPVQDLLYLSIELPSEKEFSVELLNINGQSLYNISKKKYNSGENIVKFDLQGFASSIYIVKIASAEGYRYIKVTKT